MAVAGIFLKLNRAEKWRVSRGQTAKGEGFAATRTGGRTGTKGENTPKRGRSTADKWTTVRIRWRISPATYFADRIPASLASRKPIVREFSPPFPFPPFPPLCVSFFSIYCFGGMQIRPEIVTPTRRYVLSQRESVFSYTPFCATLSSFDIGPDICI